MYYCFVAEFKHGPIPADSFADYVKVMHTDGDYKFNQEFEVKSIIFISPFVHYNLTLLPVVVKVRSLRLCDVQFLFTISVPC